MMDHMSIQESLPMPLHAWVESVMGERAAQFVEQSPLAALALAEAKSLDTASVEVLQAWGVLLGNYDRLLLQARVSLVRIARRSGWSNEDLANALKVETADLDRCISRLEDELIQSHPGFRSS
jgi:hypothetical protein